MKFQITFQSSLSIFSSIIILTLICCLCWYLEDLELKPSKFAFNLQLVHSTKSLIRISNIIIIKYFMIYVLAQYEAYYYISSTLQIYYALTQSFFISSHTDDEFVVDSLAMQIPNCIHAKWMCFMIQLTL